MIVLPTEKRFDWRHAPVMLFVIVILNVLVFFLYQSGDDEKINKAMDRYVELDYFALEWPLYQQFLTANGEHGALAGARALYDDDKLDELMLTLLLRRDFYHYLSSSAYQYLGWQAEQWLDHRSDINDAISRSSYGALALSPSQSRWVTFFSHQFLHGDIAHLLGNLFFLVVCGFAVEAAIGHLRFLLFYLIAGAAGGLLHVVVHAHETIPLVGASGAISGVMAMYLGIFRLKKIEFFYWFFVLVGYFRAPALLLLPFYIGKELLMYHSDTSSNIAFMAHVGGFVGGTVLIVGMLYFFPQLFNQEYIEEDQSIDPYRQELAGVYDKLEQFRFDAARSDVDNMAARYGMNFDLAYLRFSTQKFLGLPALASTLSDLFSVREVSLSQLKKMEQTWNDYPELIHSLSPEVVVGFALMLCQLPEPSTAARLCDALFKKDKATPSLALLAQKLALHYGQQRQPSKQNHYQHIADVNSPIQGRA